MSHQLNTLNFTLAEIIETLYQTYCDRFPNPDYIDAHQSVLTYDPTQEQQLNYKLTYAQPQE